MDVPRTIVVTGAPAVGKSTACALLADRFPRVAHVEADVLHRMIASGGEWPSAGTPEAARQLLLRTRNAAQVARNFGLAGFLSIIDEVVVSAEQVEIFDEVLGDGEARFVVLTAPIPVLLERDGTRDKHTAANYPDAGPAIDRLLADRATFIDTTHLTAASTAAALEDLLRTVVATTQSRR